MGREWAIWNGTLGEEWDSDLQLTLQAGIYLQPIIEEQFVKATIHSTQFVILNLNDNRDERDVTKFVILIIWGGRGLLKV